MRRFVPRLYNVISFLIALFIFFPWTVLKDLMYKLSNNGEREFFQGLGSFFERYNGYRLLVLPMLLVLFSIIFLAIACVDKAKSKTNTTSRPIENMVFAPIYFLGSASAISGMLYYAFSLFTKTDTKFIIYKNDFYGLGILFKDSELLTSGTIGDYAGLILFSILLLLQVLFAIILRRTYRRKFFGKFMIWLLFVLLALISIKGLFVNYTDYGTFSGLFKSCIPDSVYIYKATEKALFNDFELYIYYGIVPLALILYISIGIFRMHRNNVKFFKKDRQQQKKDFSNYKSPFESNNDKNDESIYNGARREQIIETQVEEKVVVRDVDFEPSNLDQIFSYNFEFNNVTMVREGVYVDYYVNRVKFLTLSNYNKTMSFRLELDKAIRLIVEHPMIGKDKYENHKIWFKIDDASILPNEFVINVVKDAYNAALNNL